jgi:hypothetical protein
MRLSPSRVTLGLGVLVAFAVMGRLFSVLPEVPNTNTVTYDAARRALLNVEAADALRSGNLFRFVGYVAGPETWPTLRLTIAAPVHVVLGPSRALAVETWLSIAFVGALLVMLAYAATRVARGSWSSVGVFTIAAAGILGNRPLLEHAADGMLEVPSALFTLAAGTAWIASRDSNAVRPWVVALAGNLMFHTKWQHGMIFAAAVLVTETLESRAGPILAGLRDSVLRALRRPPTALLLLTAVAVLGMAGWVASTGGGELWLLGVRISARRVHGPLAFGSLALFAFVQLALWQERTALRTIVPERLRFLWVWLASPMAAWLLVPFSRRLQVLTETSFTYALADPPRGLERVFYFPAAAWRSWFPGEARWIFAALLIATLIAAWREPVTRRLLVPAGALVLCELVLLTGVNSRNFQTRFVLNLAPLVILFAASWVPAIRSRFASAALALGATVLLAIAVQPQWERPALITTLSAGFWEPEIGNACRELAERLPLTGGVFVNEVVLRDKPTCAMWVRFVARAAGAEVHVRGDPPGDPGPQALRISDGSQPRTALEGLEPDSPEIRVGPFTGQRYTRRR